MNVSKAGIALIKHFEGVRNRPYRDCIGLWTVGVGHLIGDGKLLPDSWNRTFSEEEIDALLRTDLRRFELGVSKMLPNVPLRQCEFDAILSATFNMGNGWLQRSSMRQALLRNDKRQAMESLMKCCKAGGKVIKGLELRRLAEKKLFES